MTTFGTRHHDAMANPAVRPLWTLHPDVAHLAL
jgi:hypothetical protein